MHDGFIYGFLKYHPLEYLQSFQDGNLYCNSIQTFGNLDPLDGRGDKFEYVVKQTFGKSATLDLVNGDLNITHIVGVRVNPDYHIYTYYNREFYANLFCLYAITSQNSASIERFELPEQLRTMGTHVLIIWDSVEFVERVKAALKKNDMQYQINLVEYIDLNNFEGKKTYFQKPLRYAYQHEYRIMIKNFKDDVLNLNIGSIKDISTIFETDMIKRIKLIRN